MAKYFAKLVYGTDEDDFNTIGEFETIEDAINASWTYAHKNGYTRDCDDEISVKEALTTRQYCILGYGDESIEIEEG